MTTSFTLQRPEDQELLEEILQRPIAWVVDKLEYKPARDAGIVDQHEAFTMEWSQVPYHAETQLIEQVARRLSTRILPTGNYRGISCPGTYTETQRFCAWLDMYDVGLFMRAKLIADFVVQHWQDVAREHLQQQKDRAREAYISLTGIDPVRL